MKFRPRGGVCNIPLSGMLHTPPLGLNFVPKFLGIDAKINVSQYHKSIYRTKMETAGAYHMRPPRSSSADYNCPTGP